MDNITWFHNFLFVLITVITLFVLALLIDRRRQVQRQGQSGPLQDHPQHPDRSGLDPDPGADPGRHRGAVVPAAVPGARLPKADLTVKATGKQWYWSYAYPDNGKFEFDSLLAHGQAAAAARRRQRDGGAGQQGGPGPDHRRRRDPLLRGAGLRHQDRRHPRPPQRDLVQGHQDRHVLRPVLGTVRQGPCLHADRTVHVVHAIRSSLPGYEAAQDRNSPARPRRHHDASRGGPHR